MKPFILDPEEMKRLLAVSRGDAPADLVLRGGQLVNVLTGEIYPAEVAIYGGRIAGVAERDGTYKGNTIVELGGEFIAPGFIDAHVHLESSMVLPTEFANAVLPRGTTSVISDPHEIANVHGLDGIRFMLAASDGLPLRVFVMLSSCVPATDMETSGARLGVSDLASLLDHPRVLGIAEMMNYPGVVNGVDDMVQKATLGHTAGLRVDGHVPLVRGLPLQAYASAGISSDHESVSAPEAMEKLRSGFQVLIREGSTARNLDALLPIVNERTARFCSFATDDRQPDDLETQGHIDYIIRKATAQGLDPVLAIQLATINTARHFGLDDLGAIAPGYHADLVTFKDIRDLHVTRTFAGGQLVAQDGQVAARATNTVMPPINNMLVPDLTEASFRIPATGTHARVIQALPEQIVTRSMPAEVRVLDGEVVADTERDILKIAVIERHRRTGNIGLGLVSGFSLRVGALASSIAHDSHNLVVVGVTSEDMMLAARTVADMGGGICAVSGGQVLGKLPLTVAGLMSDQPLEHVATEMRRLLQASMSLGCTLANPYMAMAFLALPVIPELKLTDMGLVDVMRFAICPLFLTADEVAAASTS